MKRMVFAALVSLGSAAQAAGPDDDLRWSVAASGGATVIEGGGDQAFGGVSVTRAIGDSYIQVGAVIVDGGDDAGIVTSIPAATREIKLAGGTAIGAFSIDAYAAVGDRRFDTATFQRKSGQRLTATSHGSLFSAGASITYDLAISPSVFVSPTAALDYSQIDTARAVAAAGGGSVADRSSQRGVTASGGLAIQHLFGQDARNALALNAAFVRTSNDAAVNRVVAGGTAARSLGLRDGGGAADSWVEFGGSTAFKLSTRLTLDLTAVRSAGQSSGDSTALSAGIRLGF